MHFAFSYEPLMGKEPEVVEAEDIVPQLDTFADAVRNLSHPSAGRLA